MNEPFDIVIVAAPKDFGKIKYLIRSIRHYLTGYNKVYFIVPDRNALMHYRDWTFIYNEKEVLDIDLRKIKYRPQWIYQQLLKLFQNVTENDLYMTVDADLIFNRSLPMFNEKGQRIWWIGKEQYHKPYYAFNKAVLGLDRLYKGTFLADLNFFDRRIIKEMLEVSGYTQETFIEKVTEVTSKELHMSEADTFSQYVYKHHPDLYELRRLKVDDLAKEMSSMPWNYQAWTDEELEARIEAAKGKNIDVLTNHSWMTTNEVH